MSIDKSGKWWKGSNIEDIKEYLKAYSQQSYPVGKVVIAKCECGCQEFIVEFDWDEGVTRLVCPKCKKVKYLADSEENWEGVKPKKYKCFECKNNHANVGTGFSYRDNGDVKWVWVGVRCSRCGTLGSVTEWKIDYGPTEDLEKKV